MLKVVDFCLSSCLEEKQSQAIASKQFGSMYESRDIDDLCWPTCLPDNKVCIYHNLWLQYSLARSKSWGAS